MNSGDKEDLVQYRLSKSRSTLKEVYNLLELTYYNTAINRLYYAAFYAVLALLLKFNINAKSHAGVRKMFGLNFISTGKITRSSGKVFTELFDKRQKGDYNDFFDFDKKTVEELIEPTSLLISEIEKLINNQ